MSRYAQSSLSGLGHQLDRPEDTQGGRWHAAANRRPVQSGETPESRAWGHGCEDLEENSDYLIYPFDGQASDIVV